MNAKIMGTGYELPAFRADNDYLATLVDTSDGCGSTVGGYDADSRSNAAGG